MARVFVLGAGATKAVIRSAPLNDDLLHMVFELQSGNSRIATLTDFICNFYFGSTRDCTNVDTQQLPPIEDVLSQLDYCLAEQRPLSARYSLDKLRELRENLLFALFKVLEAKLRRDSNLMWQFIMKLTREDVIVSLNYDLVVDNAIVSTGGRVSYGIPVRKIHRFNNWNIPSPEWDHTILKPHGSLNWLYCPRCQAVDVYEGEKRALAIFDDSSVDRVCWKCGVRYDPIVITPTFLKSYRNNLITQIWQATEAALCDAEQIVFVGYSLPDADIMLRTMFSRAWYINQERHGPNCTVTVVDKSSSPADASALRQKYERLFRSISYFGDGFESYVDDVMC